VLRAVPRHRFMPGASISEAYWNNAHPIGHGQTISQPTVVAIMTDALRLDGTERVLEIGTGSGYQAAILAKLARDVYSIEIVPALATDATERLRALGYANVHVKHGDGYRGWPEHAPFDRVLLTAAPPELPSALVAQLRDGGIVVAPVGDRDQMLYRWTKKNGALSRETLASVRFVPMVEATPGR
jgi:protein-L-isoaspartate(D-aspartate) O-methyltransferase